MELSEASVSDLEAKISESIIQTIATTKVYNKMDELSNIQSREPASFSFGLEDCCECFV